MSCCCLCRPAKAQPRSFSPAKFNGDNMNVRSRRQRGHAQKPRARLDLVSHVLGRNLNFKESARVKPPWGENTSSKHIAGFQSQNRKSHDNMIDKHGSRQGQQTRWHKPGALPCTSGIAVNGCPDSLQASHDCAVLNHT